MIKAFISHSSKQKTSYAEPIVETVGRDLCIYDAYDFEPAYPTVDEIIDKMEQSTIFVFLASKESLGSDWCRDEVSKAEKLYRRGTLRGFHAYIIDPEVGIEDIPDWISKEECINLKYFRSPKLIAKDIRQKIRRLQTAEHPKWFDEDNIFVGRNREMTGFQKQQGEKPKATSMIISGRTGTGRESFAKRCMSEVGVAPHIEPEVFNLNRDESIEDFLSQLNSVTYLLSDDILAEVLVCDEDVKIEYAVRQINEISKYTPILIKDTRSIVRDGGILADWFDRMIDHPQLHAHLRTFLTSSIKLRANIPEDKPSLIYIKFDAPTDEDRSIILKRYINEYKGDALSKEERDYFIQRLLYSPQQLKTIGKIIAQRGIREAKLCLGSEEDKANRKLKSLLSDFIDDDDAYQLLILMSKLDTASYDDLQEIYGDKYEEIQHLLDNLTDASILSPFGPSRSYLRIDPAVADYIKRGKNSLSKNLRRNLDRFLQKIINDKKLSITDDLPTYIHYAQNAYLNGEIKTEDLLIPSIALKAIISLYQDKKDYSKVKDLCEDFLEKGHKINLNPRFREDVTFWLCLSLCHLKIEKDFRKWVNEFGDTRKAFLKGFWCRQNQDYVEAKRYYQKVLDSRSSTIKRRAKSEMCIVLEHFKQYDDAYILAKENYDEDKDNPYAISILLSVSIKRQKRDFESDRLHQELIERMKGLKIRNKEQYLAAMQLYACIRDRGISKEKQFEGFNRLRTTYPEDERIQYMKDAIKYASIILGINI